MNRTQDRILVIAPRDDKRYTKVKSGDTDYKKIDRRKIDDFNLHIVWNNTDNMWRFRFDPPATVPEKLKIRFTKWQDILKYAEIYYADRNCYIKEILD